MMGGPKFSIADAGRLPDELHIGVLISHVRLDLLQSAGGKEARGRADERDLSAIGETSADADHVLLGDADVDGPLRPPLAEAAELRRSDAVVDNDEPEPSGPRTAAGAVLSAGDHRANRCRDHVAVVV